MSGNLIDNRSYGKLETFLNEKIKQDSELTFVSAYFTIFAYRRLQEKLDNIKSMRFLFGEPTFLKGIDPSRKQRQAYQINSDSIQQKIDTILTQSKIARDCYKWINEKVEVKSLIKPQFLHGKAYMIKDPRLENRQADAVVGSSNFTTSGLGYSNRPNMELNIEVDSKDTTEKLYDWFNELWNNESLVRDVKEEILEYLKKLYQDNSPQTIYFLTLFRIFEDYYDLQAKTRDLDERIGFYDTKIWKDLYDFQKQGVKAVINRIEQHNGCILADSVGLGKTYEALAIIKYFQMKQKAEVLVLCPKKLRENWTLFTQNSELNPFHEDRFTYDVLNHTDLTRKGGKSGDLSLSGLKWGGYDLVVIDESHNFRNNKKYRISDDEQVLTRYGKLIENVMKKGRQTRVLMLTATPVNTQLKDLRNQISIITEENFHAFHETLKIPDYSITMQKAQTEFMKWSKDDSGIEHLSFDSDFITLLDAVTIARSRDAIKKHFSTERMGSFPKRKPVNSIYPKIDKNNRFMSYDKINDELEKVKLAMYNPTHYVMKEHREHYQKLSPNAPIAFDQSKREYFLIGMMKANLLKRLESSIHSFDVSIERTLEKLDQLIERLESYKKGMNDRFDIDLDIEEDEDNPESMGKKIPFEFKHLDIEDLLDDLKSDRDQIVVLKSQSEVVSPARDAKMAKLKELLKDKSENPINEGNKKALVFTAFSDTAQYLYENLKDWAQQELGLHIGLVTGSAGNRSTFNDRRFPNQLEFNTVLTNFSPLSKDRQRMEHMPQHDEIDILIATDCISEGQNLQDCDFVINYDIHWNPIRLIQRFGRIDRLKSHNEWIKMVNFWPTEDLDKYINLKKRVETRMYLVDIAGSGQNNIINDDDSDIELEFRSKQLLRMKDEILDMDQVNNSAPLGNFTLQEFRDDLVSFLASFTKEKEDFLRTLPNGLMALVAEQQGKGNSHPKHSKHEQRDIEPGVIFCMKYVGKMRDMEKVNPRPPFFLIYMDKDGKVKYNFTDLLTILKLFKDLCSDRTQPDEELCRVFDRGTDFGRDVSQYSVILKKALKSIRANYTKTEATALTSNRTFTLARQDEKPQKDSDFELLTWLVIK